MDRLNWTGKKERIIVCWTNDECVLPSSASFRERERKGGIHVLIFESLTWMGIVSRASWEWTSDAVKSHLNTHTRSHSDSRRRKKAAGSASAFCFSVECWRNAQTEKRREEKREEEGEEERKQLVNNLNRSRTRTFWAASSINPLCVTLSLRCFGAVGYFSRPVPSRSVSCDPLKLIAIGGGIHSVPPSCVVLYANRV